MLVCVCVFSAQNKKQLFADWDNFCNLLKNVERAQKVKLTQNVDFATLAPDVLSISQLGEAEAWCCTCVKISNNNAEMPNISVQPRRFIFSIEVTGKKDIPTRFLTSRLAMIFIVN